MEFTLKNPIDFEGKPIEKLDMNLEALTAADMADIEQHLVSNGESVGVNTMMSLRFQYAMAARASKLPLEAINALSAKDGAKVAMEVQSFLLE